MLLGGLLLLLKVQCSSIPGTPDANSIGKTRSSKVTTPMIIGACIGAAFLIVIFSLMAFIFLHRRRREQCMWVIDSFKSSNLFFFQSITVHHPSECIIRFLPAKVHLELLNTLDRPTSSHTQAAYPTNSFVESHLSDIISNTCSPVVLIALAVKFIELQVDQCEIYTTQIVKRNVSYNP